VTNCAGSGGGHRWGEFEAGSSELAAAAAAAEAAAHNPKQQNGNERESET